MNKFFPSFLFIFGAISLSAQDIYDYKHSHAYARYLLQSQQYALAAEGSNTRWLPKSTKG